MGSAGSGEPLPRLAAAQFLRRPLQTAERWLPLPNVPPAAWSVAGVLLSFGAAAATGDARAALVAAVLLADWLDGATARRHGARAHGQLVDVAADRISEVVLFASDPSALRLALFALAVGNLVLVAAARRRGRHLALPLRLGYLAVLALRR